MADLNYINVSSLNLSVPDISNDTVINGTCPWGNDTQYDPDPTLDMVYGVGFGVLFVICTIGNIINIAVLSAMKSSQSSAVYLLAMAIADIVTVWLYFWQFLFTVRPDIFVSTNGFDWFNDNIQGAYVWLQQVFMAFSYWVLAAFSSERVIAVINPLKFRTTRRTTQILVSCIFIYCCISNICRLVTQYWMWANLDIDTFDKESASMFSSTWPSWLTTWNSVQVVYTNVEVFIVCTILIASTTIILTSIVRHQKTLGIRATTNSAVSDKKNKKDFGRTILIVTSIGFCPLAATQYHQ
ncbi:uncharacterized protein LOC129599803 [Paramacrobiotus metropolitanus]|uniref:uncharacterized protein LOC129599803 n=1 Tax=Paramacrobiotus metropolitanus TaxID=2943436 RepID=UPI002445B43C|nr:uncharacterized protein LOC129599803 [Paramacrobiotus metropolitanus]